MSTRGYPNYNQITPSSYGENGRMNTSYAATAGYADHVCRPVVVDAEGRKNPIIRYTPTHDSDGYVVKAEKVVEHVTRAPVISIVMTDYRPYDSEPDETEEVLLKDYGVEKRYTQIGSTYNHPAENFLAKIQSEVSQPPKVSGPFNSSRRARPISTGQEYGNNRTTKYGDDKDFMIKGDNQKKIYSVPIGDKQMEGYRLIPQGTNPVIASNKHKLYERPNEGHVFPSRPLSRPTNDINDAVGFLTEGIRTIPSDVSKPTPKAGNSGVRWRKGLEVYPDEDDSVKVKKQNMDGMDNVQKSYQEAVNPTENKDYEKAEGINRSVGSKLFGQRPTSFPAISQQLYFTVPPTQPKEVNSLYPEIIDSSEARKRYGKQKSQAVPENARVEVINSDDLIKKYNGTKVPW